jgi:hypothetical protein
MPNVRQYVEDSLGLSTNNESAIAGSFQKMRNAMSRVNLDPFRNTGDICKSPEMLQMLTESVQLSPTATSNKYQVEDVNRLNTLYENVSKEILNEAVSNIGDISPILINSFGIQERALISAHLPRAVKQVTAKIDNFKLTERIPYIVDLAGNKSKFIDAFVPTETGEQAHLELRDVVPFSFTIPANDIDLYAGSDTGDSSDPNEGDAGYRPQVDKEQVFGFNSILDTVTITGADADTIEFGVNSLRTPDVENGNFQAIINWKESGTAKTAVVSGQFDLSNGKLIYISSTDSAITDCTFNMVLSPETHTKALSVGYDIKHTPVNIPIGEHFEYSISEEFKDASDKYYNVDAMALLTDYMGRGVEQVKDMVTLAKYQELAKKAIVKTKFNCTPTVAFAQGKEEYIRREFHPFMEKVCIILKNKVRIPNCHFRVVGNPLDIRVAGSAGVEYVYKRNEEFAGEIGIDYEFSVSSDIHKIFYLSSERVPAGKVLVFLIPNTIENNISTVNHYEYATYVSNKYRGTKSNLPTVIISTRYLTKEYFPVMAEVEIVNNLTDDATVTVASGEGLADSVYSKVQYVNA